MTDLTRPGIRSISNATHFTYRRVRIMGIGASIVGMLAVAAIVFWGIKSLNEEDIWGIGLYSGDDPLRLKPHPAAKRQPVIAASDVTDVSAKFVADPFLTRSDQQWLMFFEVLNNDTKRGEIAYASSVDAVDWRYESIVLREPFHLSYPYVFQFETCYYMIPESAEARSVRLYKAVDFPAKWTLVSELLQGTYRDPSIVRKDGFWWLFAERDNRVLELYVAQELTGPWTEHPLSPIADDQRLTRPAGRVIQSGNRLIRFSQDGKLTYGHRVYASEISALTPESYAERLASGMPIVCASGQGWNAHGMHHIDAHRCADGQWIAAVDGKQIRKTFNWRKGARAVVNLLRA